MVGSFSQVTDDSTCKGYVQMAQCSRLFLLRKWGRDWWHCADTTIMQGNCLHRYCEFVLWFALYRGFSLRWDVVAAQHMYCTRWVFPLKFPLIVDPWVYCMTIFPKFDWCHKLLIFFGPSHRRYTVYNLRILFCGYPDTYMHMYGLCFMPL